MIPSEAEKTRLRVAGDSGSLWSLVIHSRQPPLLSPARVAELAALIQQSPVAPARCRLTFCWLSDEESYELNLKHRSKPEPAAVLAFPGRGGRHPGSVLLSPASIARQAENYHKRVPDHAAHLLVHGTLHLFGLNHGRTMERLEERILKKAGCLAAYLEHPAA